MIEFDPQSYSPVVAEVLVGVSPPELGPGTPHAAMRPRLQALSIETVFAGRPVVSRDMARGCLAGLWLVHNFLDPSHEISQEIHTPTGSFWHGIMHRREPDYGNAKYWFRRVGEHPVFEPLRQEAAALTEAEPASPLGQLARQRTWDPFRMVDLCEQAARGNSALAGLCRQAAWAEWRLLFDYCYRQATGAD